MPRQRHVVGWGGPCRAQSGRPITVPLRGFRPYMHCGVQAFLPQEMFRAVLVGQYLCLLQSTTAVLVRQSGCRRCSWGVARLALCC